MKLFPLDAPAQPFRPLGALPLGYPDLWNYSNRDYGARIGAYRHHESSGVFGIRATAAVNPLRARSPRGSLTSWRRKWEIIANGVDMGHVHHGGLTVDSERKLIRPAA